MIFEGQKCFFHVDLDAFYASVEQLAHPKWKGLPVVVGGVPGDKRAVVSTASYEARKFGVRSAMPLSKAVSLCPDAIFVRPNFALYSEYSEKVMKIFFEYSPDVRQVSIDEAFLDLTGTERLFGSPIETAKKIKSQVFKLTGLTVSVGISVSPYIAKIASDLQKPNGLTAVLPGDEEEFVLNLPLEKIWGVGKKTLERLWNAGFKTTRQVHDASQKLLQSIFGKAQGEFLFCVSHGKTPKGFLEEAKTHSAGIEKTFESDLVEWDSIEAALLDLSEHLMFRLLRGGVTGKTLCVKIRYEDFSTVSCRETFFQNVTSVEDLFLRTKKIFRKKYVAGRAVRLLGLSVENTQDAESETQGELFDFGEGKKRKVEKSILNLQKKNPAIKIHKARLIPPPSSPNPLRMVFAFLAPAFFFALMLFTPPQLFSETKVLDASGSGSMVVGKMLPPEKPPEGAVLFDVDIKDSHLKFEAFGFWNAELSQTLKMTFGFGNDFEFSAETPVFKQEVDLSLSFLLNDHWFFDAAFADEFSTNTIAAGYTNGEKYLKEVRVSNRYVTFPNTYSVDDVGRGIGGGKNQAPGVSVNFSDPEGAWQTDAAVRYDMLVQREKTFYGKNSVNDTDRAKSAFVTGRMFVLPSYESAANVDEVFVEAYGGSYTDEAGKKYKRLSTSQYVVIPARKMILLSSDAGAEKKGGGLPAVAVAFRGGGSSLVRSELGTYGSAAAPGTGFLGDVQKEFGADLQSGVPNVASFSYGGKSRGVSVPDPSGNSIEGFFGRISGSEVLFVQHSAGFSPFAAAFRYDFGSNKIDEILVVEKHSGKSISQFAAIQAEDDFSVTEQNYFSAEKFYADAFSTRSSSSDYANPLVRFPFCRISPGAYLGFGENDDIVIRARSYTSVNRFDIGTDAVAGTVMVYKNAVLDSGAKYNAESGEVTLSSAVSSTDKIYIVWAEESSSFESGAIAAAAGFSYNITENLLADVSSATRWSVSPYTDFSDSVYASSGYATLASKIKFQNENFTVSNTVAGTVENSNTTGYFRIFGFDDAPSKTSYLSKNAGADLPKNFSPRLNKRPQSANAAIELDGENCATSAAEGFSEKGITGYKIPVSFNFTGDASEWAAQTILISGGGLSSASHFTFALKTEAPILGAEVYLQLGVSGEEDFSYENKGSIPTWKISLENGSPPPDVKAAFNPGLTGWQEVCVILNDADRFQCAKNSAARIIVKNSEGVSGGGTIFFGPYEISQKGVFVLCDEDFSVMSSQVRSQNSSAQKFNKDTNYAQEISWTWTGAASPKNSNVTLYKFFEESDISDYAKIEVLFKCEFFQEQSEGENDDAAFVFVLDSEEASGEGEGKIAAKAEISQEAFLKYADGKWHTLSILKDNRSVKIDDEAIPFSQCALRIKNENLASRAKIILNTATKNGFFKSGIFCVDEIFLSETSPHFILEDKSIFEYKNEEGLFAKNGYNIFRNIETHAQSRESLTLYTQEGRPKKGDINADAFFKFTFADVNFFASAARAAESEKAISAAAHAISSDKAILQILDFEEEFNFDLENDSAQKMNFAKLDFSKLNVPLSFSKIAKSEKSEWSSSAQSENLAALSLEGERVKYKLQAGTQTSQKILSSASGKKTESEDGYFSEWLSSTKNAFSLGDPLASKRKVSAFAKNTLAFSNLNFSPELNFSSEENYTKTKAAQYSDKTFFELRFPFRVKKNSISFSWKKISGGVKETSGGGGYASDAFNLCDTLKSRGYFFATPIFYDLFSERLQSRVQKNVASFSNASSSAGGSEAAANFLDGQVQSEYYTGEYAVNFSRPVFSDKFDIVVPSSATLSVARDIRAGQTLSDTYQAKLHLGWTAFNIFGREGVVPIAKWFLEDEYISSFIMTLKIPREEVRKITQVYTTYLQANFYIQKDNALKNGFQFEFQDKNNFQAKFTSLWQRAGKRSPILAFANLFSKKFDAKKIPITRNDSLNFSWRKNVSGEKVRHFQSYEFSHSVDFHILKYFSLSTGVDLGFSCDKDEICEIAATWSLGGKLLF